MDRKSLFSSALVELVIVSFIFTFYSLVDLSVLDIRQFYPLFLYIFAPLMLIINRVFLTKDRNAIQIVILNFIFIIIFEIVLLFLYREKTIVWKSVTFPISIFLSFYSLKLILKGIEYKKLLRLFDLSVLVFLICSVLSTEGRYSMEITYTPLCAIFISLFAIIIKKRPSHGSRSSFLTDIFLFFLIALMTVFFSGYSSIAGKGIVKFWSLIVSVIQKIGNIISLLVSKIPRFSYREDENLIPLVTDDPYKTDKLVTPVMDERTLLIIILVAGVVLALVIIFYFMRNIRVKNLKVKKIEKKRISKPSFFQGVRKALALIRGKIDIKLFIMRKKNTYIGLYLWLMESLKRDRMRKKEVESAREFLTRIDTAFSISLSDDFISRIEAWLYGGDKNNPQYPEAESVRHAINLRKRKSVLPLKRK